MKLDTKTVELTHLNGLKKINKISCKDCSHCGSWKMICYEMGSYRWFDKVMDLNCECDFFEQRPDIGDRYEFTYPQKELDE